MEPAMLKRKLSTYVSDGGRLLNVLEELLLEIVNAWEGWTGTAKADMRQSLREILLEIAAVPLGDSFNSLFKSQLFKIVFKNRGQSIKREVFSWFGIHRSVFYPWPVIEVQRDYSLKREKFTNAQF